MLELFFLLNTSVAEYAQTLMIISGLVMVLTIIAIFSLKLGKDETIPESYGHKNYLNGMPLVKKAFTISIIIFITCSIISRSAYITPDSLFKTRIALIKYRLASPENLDKGLDYIRKLGEKLEKRYLPNKK